MPEFIHIKHPDIEALGGPVERSTLSHWEKKGWVEATDDEAKAAAEAEAAAVETATNLTEASLNAIRKRDDLNEIALRRGIDPTSHDNMESLRDAVRSTL
jgi:hypothetical protein